MSYRSENLSVPSQKDLISRIRFASQQGKIWFQEQRMVLIHAAVLGELTRELVETLGMERASGFLMRFGYYSGLRDAELAKQVRPDMTPEEAFMAGPQLHSIKGMVKVELRSIEIDPENEKFHAEADWYSSFEAEQFHSHFGTASHPVCWSLLGYASGYSTYFFGKPILFKEVQCEAMGHEHCSIVGKLADHWEDKDVIEKLLQPDRVDEQLGLLQQQLNNLKASFQQQELAEDYLTNAIGQSDKFLTACQMVKKASQGKVTVLLLGETGVGKEVIARGLHASSDRSQGPFIAVNCACIPPDLIEAELFGVERGAYTGAHISREGRFERANGGTIFLDEVIELSPRAQATLLRVLQEEEVERVGGAETRSIDVRVVAATNEDLSKAVEEGRFRSDLYFRLNVFPVHIPPLRDRKDDIALLVEHFLERYQTRYNKQVGGISDKAMQALMAYKWPGNIRELENMIERGVILTDSGRTIELGNLFPSLSEPSHPLNAISRDGSLVSAPKEMQADDRIDGLINDGLGLDYLEQQMIQRAMNRAEGNITQAARLLGLTRPALAYRLKKLGILD